jgi:predicted ATPase
MNNYHGAVHHFTLRVLITQSSTKVSQMDERRSNALAEFRKKLLEHREVEAAVKECKTCFSE